jgi:hypothetical protein
MFLLAHIEDYKSADNADGITNVRQRLKVLGSMATKMNIEGSVVNTFYTYVTMEGTKPKFQLRTQNTGYNTGRSQEELFAEETIPNNFQLILDALDAY